MVEDRKDPLKTGRCRVRIVGIHTDNKQMLPTEALPWAGVMTSAQLTDIPAEGEWVVGFFMEGETDFPIIFGVMRGIKLVESNPQVGFSDPRTEDEKLNAPKWPDGTTAQKLDEPTTPRISRGDISDTLIKKQNDEKEHVCDPSLLMRIDMLQIKAQLSMAVQWLRKQFESLFSGLSTNPMTQQLRAFIKMITAKLKEFQRVIKQINDIVTEVREIVQQIQQLVAYILSLPARLLEYVKACLADFVKMIEDTLKEAFFQIADPTGTVIAISDVEELISTTTETINLAANTVQNATETVSETFSLSNYQKA
ncbi:MAG: hypothetical protein ACO239_00440 [Sediminibacterium sp.]